MNRRFFIPASASILMAIMASAFSLSCTQERTHRERPMQVYEEASFLWQRLLRRHKLATEAARAPGIEDVKSALAECANFPLCQNLQKEIDAARIRGEAEEREREKRAKEYAFNPATATASPNLQGRTHEIHSENANESDVSTSSGLGIVANSKEASDGIRPRKDMDETAFRQAFGDCFEHFGQLSVEDVGEGEALTLKTSDDCLKNPDLSDLKGQAVLVVAGKIESIRPIEELNPVPKIFYQGKEITESQRDCILKNYERAQAGDTTPPKDCFSEEKPAEPESAAEVTTIGSV